MKDRATAGGGSLMVGLSISLLAAGFLLSGCVSGGGAQALTLQHRIEHARSRADHEDLAAHFEREAKALRAKANEHEQMVRSYGWSGYAAATTDYVRHCADLARKYGSAADDNLGLAKLHRGLAEKAAQ